MFNYVAIGVANSFWLSTTTMHYNLTVLKTAGIYCTLCIPVLVMFLVIVIMCVCT